MKHYCLKITSTVVLCAFIITNIGFAAPIESSSNQLDFLRAEAVRRTKDGETELAMAVAHIAKDIQAATPQNRLLQLPIVPALPSLQLLGDRNRFAEGEGQDIEEAALEAFEVVTGRKPDATDHLTDNLMLTSAEIERIGDTIDDRLDIPNFGTTLFDKVSEQVVQTVRDVIDFTKETKSSARFAEDEAAADKPTPAELGYTSAMAGMSVLAVGGSAARHKLIKEALPHCEFAKCDTGKALIVNVEARKGLQPDIIIMSRKDARSYLGRIVGLWEEVYPAHRPTIIVAADKDNQFGTDSFDIVWKPYIHGVDSAKLSERLNAILAEEAVMRDLEHLMIQPGNPIDTFWICDKDSGSYYQIRRQGSPETVQVGTVSPAFLDKMKAAELETVMLDQHAMTRGNPQGLLTILSDLVAARQSTGDRPIHRDFAIQKGSRSGGRLMGLQIYFQEPKAETAEAEAQPVEWVSKKTVTDLMAKLDMLRNRSQMPRRRRLLWVTPIRFGSRKTLEAVAKEVTGAIVKHPILSLSRPLSIQTSDLPAQAGACENVAKEEYPKSVTDLALMGGSITEAQAKQDFTKRMDDRFNSALDRARELIIALSNLEPVSGMTFLIADDDAGVSAAVKAALVERNAQDERIVITSTAAEALKQLDTRPAAVIIGLAVTDEEAGGRVLGKANNLNLKRIVLLNEAEAGQDGVRSTVKQSVSRGGCIFDKSPENAVDVANKAVVLALAATVSEEGKQARFAEDEFNRRVFLQRTAGSAAATAVGSLSPVSLFAAGAAAQSVYGEMQSIFARVKALSHGQGRVTSYSWKIEDFTQENVRVLAEAGFNEIIIDGFRMMRGFAKPEQIRQAIVEAHRAGIRSIKFTMGESSWAYESSGYAERVTKQLCSHITGLKRSLMRHDHRSAADIVKGLVLDIEPYTHLRWNGNLAPFVRIHSRLAAVAQRYDLTYERCDAFWFGQNRTEAGLRLSDYEVPQEGSMYMMSYRTSGDEAYNVSRDLAKRSNHLLGFCMVEGAPVGFAGIRNALPDAIKAAVNKVLAEGAVNCHGIFIHSGRIADIVTEIEKWRRITTARSDSDTDPKKKPKAITGKGHIEVLGSTSYGRGKARGRKFKLKVSLPKGISRDDVLLLAFKRTETWWYRQPFTESYFRIPKDGVVEIKIPWRNYTGRAKFIVVDEGGFNALGLSAKSAMLPSLQPLRNVIIAQTTQDLRATAPFVPGSLPPLGEPSTLSPLQAAALLLADADYADGRMAITMVSGEENAGELISQIGQTADNPRLEIAALMAAENLSSERQYLARLVGETVIPPSADVLLAAAPRTDAATRFAEISEKTIKGLEEWAGKLKRLEATKSGALKLFKRETVHNTAMQLSAQVNRLGKEISRLPAGHQNLSFVYQSLVQLMILVLNVASTYDLEQQLPAAADQATSTGSELSQLAQIVEFFIGHLKKDTGLVAILKDVFENQPRQAQVVALPAIGLIIEEWDAAARLAKSQREFLREQTAVLTTKRSRLDGQLEDVILPDEQALAIRDGADLALESSRIHVDAAFDVVANSAALGVVQPTRQVLQAARDREKDGSMQQALDAATASIDRIPALTEITRESATDEGNARFAEGETREEATKIVKSLFEYRYDRKGVGERYVIFAEDAAWALDVSQDTLWEWEKAGKIPSARRARNFGKAGNPMARCYSRQDLQAIAIAMGREEALGDYAASSVLTANTIEMPDRDLLNRLIGIIKPEMLELAVIADDFVTFRDDLEFSDDELTELAIQLALATGDRVPNRSLITQILIPARKTGDVTYGEILYLMKGPEKVVDEVWGSVGTKYRGKAKIPGELGRTVTVGLDELVSFYIPEDRTMMRANIPVAAIRHDEGGWYTHIAMTPELRKKTQGVGHTRAARASAASARFAERGAGELDVYGEMTESERALRFWTQKAGEAEIVSEKPEDFWTRRFGGENWTGPPARESQRERQDRTIALWEEKAGVRRREAIDTPEARAAAQPADSLKLLAGRTAIVCGFDDPTNVLSVLGKHEISYSVPTPRLVYGTMNYGYASDQRRFATQLSNSPLLILGPKIHRNDAEEIIEIHANQYPSAARIHLCKSAVDMQLLTSYRSYRETGVIAALSDSDIGPLLVEAASRLSGEFARPARFAEGGKGIHRGGRSELLTLVSRHVDSKDGDYAEVTMITCVMPDGKQESWQRGVDGKAHAFLKANLDLIESGMFAAVLSEDKTSITITDATADYADRFAESARVPDSQLAMGSSLDGLRPAQNPHSQSTSLQATSLDMAFVGTFPAESGRFAEDYDVQVDITSGAEDTDLVALVEPFFAARIADILAPGAGSSLNDSIGQGKAYRITWTKLPGGEGVSFTIIGIIKATSGTFVSGKVTLVEKTPDETAPLTAEDVKDRLIKVCLPKVVDMDTIDADTIGSRNVMGQILHVTSSITDIMDLEEAIAEEFQVGVNILTIQMAGNDITFDGLVSLIVEESARFAEVSVTDIEAEFNLKPSDVLGLATAYSVTVQRDGQTGSRYFTDADAQYFKGKLSARAEVEKILSARAAQSKEPNQGEEAPAAEVALMTGRAPRIPAADDTPKLTPEEAFLTGRSTASRRSQARFAETQALTATRPTQRSSDAPLRPVRPSRLASNRPAYTRRADAALADVGFTYIQPSSNVTTLRLSMIDAGRKDTEALWLLGKNTPKDIPAGYIVRTQKQLRTLQAQKKIAVLCTTDVITEDVIEQLKSQLSKKLPSSIKLEFVLYTRRSIDQIQAKDIIIDQLQGYGHSRVKQWLIRMLGTMGAQTTNAQELDDALNRLSFAIAV